jgi:hypothetical protein
MGKTSKSTWKALERKVARLLGGTRNPLSGSNSGQSGDVRHPDFEIECKLGERLAIFPWFTKNAATARSSGKMPLLVVKEKGKHGELAVLRLQDLVGLLENGKGGDAVETDDSNESNPRQVSGLLCGKRERSADVSR